MAACLLNSTNVRYNSILLIFSIETNKRHVLHLCDTDSAFNFLSIEPLFVEIGSFVSLLSFIKEARYSHEEFNE